MMIIIYKCINNDVYNNKLIIIITITIIVSLFNERNI